MFGPCLLWPNGRTSQLLLSSCLDMWADRQTDRQTHTYTLTRSSQYFARLPWRGNSVCPQCVVATRNEIYFMVDREAGVMQATELWSLLNAFRLAYADQWDTSLMIIESNNLGLFYRHINKRISNQSSIGCIIDGDSVVVDDSLKANLFVTLPALELLITDLRLVPYHA